MSVADRIALAMSKMDDISREHADRRELRERQTREAKDGANANLMKQGPLAEKTIERIQEAGKRQREAGGWGTAAATEKKPSEFHFGGEDDEDPGYQAPPAGKWPYVPQAEAVAPPVAAPPPPPPPVEPPPPAPAARPQPRRRPVADDDDDFGGQSWLT